MYTCLTKPCDCALHIRSAHTLDERPRVINEHAMLLFTMGVHNQSYITDPPHHEAPRSHASQHKCVATNERQDEWPRSPDCRALSKGDHLVLGLLHGLGLRCTAS